MISETETSPKPSPVELIKESSNYLRGTILEGLADTSTGAISSDDTQLTKFHGIYQQDDRDIRKERRRQKLERAFSFMIRIRVPGGICTPEQWLVIDRLASEHANDTIKITTRQAFQLHGVLKGNLRSSVNQINKSLLTTIAACGDVNRNTICNPNPYESHIHEEVYAVTNRIAEHLSPRSRAYHEIWINGTLAAGGEQKDEEPIYGKRYLPRKFKTALAIPPRNDVDVLAHDLGFIAIVEEGSLAGFNLTVGGGMGMDHNKPATFPRLADVIGFVNPDQVLAVAEAVVTTQRDFGNRSNRKNARLKYTIEARGIDWFLAEVESRAGFTLKPSRPFNFESMGDRYGWSRGTNGKWNLNLFIENGRVLDTDSQPIRSGIREIAKIHDGDFRLTANQNLIIGNISESRKAAIEALVSRHGLSDGGKQSGIRLNSLACVALPTCGLALAESERMLPGILDQLEEVIERCGLRSDEITIRMTGCPNGCARPYNAEIGLVGKAPNRYNIYLGAAFDGTRLNKLYHKANNTAEILEKLAPIIRAYASERREGERFGDFTIRKGYVEACHQGNEFHN